MWIIVRWSSFQVFHFISTRLISFATVNSEMDQIKVKLGLLYVETMKRNDASKREWHKAVG